MEKRKKLSEYSCLNFTESDFDNVEEESENFSKEQLEELEELEHSEGDDPLFDSEECAEQGGEVGKQSEDYEIVAVDTSQPQVPCCGECCREIDPVQISDARVLTLTRKLHGKK